MKIDTLVKKIYRLNDVRDGFWNSYLDRIKDGMRVTWYHSSGFDLRPLYAIRELTSFGHEYDMSNGTFNKIGKDIQNTDIVFNDYKVHFYDALLEIWNKKRNGVLGANKPSTADMVQFLARKKEMSDDFSDLFSHTSHKYFKNFFSENTLESIEPFKLFADDERSLLEPSISHRDYYPNEAREYDSAVTQREYDGFAIKLSSFSSSHVTIIFLCLDDVLVKKVFDDYQIEVVCLFENASGVGMGGGYLFEWLYRKHYDLKNLKYIFTDNFRYDEETKRLLLNYPLLENQFTVKNYLFGRREATLWLTDTMAEKSGIGGIRITITKQGNYKENSKRFTLEFDKSDLYNGIEPTDDDYLLSNFLFGLIHGELRLKTDAICINPHYEWQKNQGKHGGGFCLAVRKDLLL